MELNMSSLCLVSSLLLLLSFLLFALQRNKNPNSLIKHIIIIIHHHPSSSFLFSLLIVIHLAVNVGDDALYFWYKGRVEKKTEDEGDGDLRRESLR